MTKWKFKHPYTQNAPTQLDCLVLDTCWGTLPTAMRTFVWILTNQDLGVPRLLILMYSTRTVSDTCFSIHSDKEKIFPLSIMGQHVFTRMDNKSRMDLIISLVYQVQFLVSAQGLETVFRCRLIGTESMPRVRLLEHSIRFECHFMLQGDNSLGYWLLS